MTPDSIPTRAPIVLQLQQDEAWILGVIVVAGVWTIAFGAHCWLSDLSRVVRARFLGVRKW